MPGCRGLQSPAPCLANNRADLTQTTGQTSPRAAQFLEWAEGQDLSLTLPPDTHTHGANMIDLSWANPALRAMGITSEVPEDFTPLADHEAVFSTFHWGDSQARNPVPPSDGAL